MTTVKRPVYLISEQQRHALLNYLKDRPYREVASGIQFLMNAPTAQVDVELPEESNIKMSETESSEAKTEHQEELVHS